MVGIEQRNRSEPPLFEPIKNRGTVTDKFEIWLARLGLGGSKVKNSAAKIIQALKEELQLEQPSSEAKGKQIKLEEERGFLYQHLHTNPRKQQRIEQELAHAIGKMTDKMDPHQLAKLEINYSLKVARDRQTTGRDLFGKVLTSGINETIQKNKPGSGLLLEARLSEGIQALASSKTQQEKSQILKLLGAMKKPTQRLLQRAKRDQYGRPSYQVTAAKASAQETTSLNFLRRLPYKTLREAAVNCRECAEATKSPNEKWFFELLQVAARAERQDEILTAEGEFLSHFSTKALQETGEQQQLTFSDLEQKSKSLLQHLDKDEYFTSLDPEGRRKELVDSFSLLHLDSLTSAQLVELQELYFEYLKEQHPGQIPPQELFLEILAATSLRKGRLAIEVALAQKDETLVKISNYLQGEVIAKDVQKTFLSGQQNMANGALDPDQQRDLAEKISAATTVGEKINIHAKAGLIGIAPLHQFTADLGRSSFSFRSPSHTLTTLIRQPIYIDNQEVAGADKKEIKGSQINEGHEIVLAFLQGAIPSSYSEQDRKRIANTITFFANQTVSSFETRAGLLSQQEAADESNHQTLQVVSGVNSETDPSIAFDDPGRKGRYYTVFLSEEEVVFTSRANLDLQRIVTSSGEINHTPLDAESSFLENEYSFALSYGELLSGPDDPKKINGYFTLKGQMKTDPYQDSGGFPEEEESIRA